MSEDHKAVWERKAKLLAKADPKLSPIIKTIGSPSITFRPNAYRALVGSILSQQLAPNAAKAITKRVAALSPPFPTYKSIKQIPDAKIREAGVSGQKLGYIRALSARWEDAGWRRGWATLENQAVIDRLTEVKGIGVWTAQMFLIFSLARPDVLAIDDYGIRRGVQYLYQLSDIPKPKDLPTLVPKWKGSESIASWYLWRALDHKLLQKAQKSD